MDCLNNSLQLTIKKLGMEKKINEKRVLLFWNKLRSGDLKHHTQADSFKNGILFVNVSSPVWAQQLFFLKRKFLKELNKELGKNIVKDIRFQCGPIIEEEVKAVKSKKLDNIVLESNEISKIKEAVDLVKEERLRNVFEKILIKNKKFQKSRKEKGWKTCSYCSSLYDPQESRCPYCQLEKEVSQLLLGSPYLTYEQCCEHFPDLLPEQYEKIKAKLIVALDEKIKSITFNQMFFADEEKIKRYLHLIQSYVILKTEVKVFAINKKVIYDILGEERADHYYKMLAKLQEGG